MQFTKRLNFIENLITKNDKLNFKKYFINALLVGKRLSFYNIVPFYNVPDYESTVYVIICRTHTHMYDCIYIICM